MMILISMDWSVGWKYCFKLFGNRKISKYSKFNSLPEWWMPKCKYWWPTFPNEGALGEFFTRGRITWIVDAKTHNLSTKQVWLPTLGQMIQTYLKCQIILLLKRVQMIFFYWKWLWTYETNVFWLKIGLQLLCRAIWMRWGWFWNMSKITFSDQTIFQPALNLIAT